MFGTQDLAWFIVSGLLLNMAPGPDSLLIVTRSATQGWRAGSAATLGICSGTFVHISAAALGLSAVLATSATAFTIVKVAGALYLVCIGIAMLLARGRPAVKARGAALPAGASPGAPGGPGLALRKIYMQGFMTNALNPKVALFFLAFVPQFIAPDAPSKALAFIALGCLFNVNSLLWNHGLAVFTALASRRLTVNAGVARWLDRLVGAMFVSFGIKLALSDRA